MEWAPDIAFGPRAESVRCPVCGTVWGVRERRPGPSERPADPSLPEAQAHSDEEAH